MLAKPTFANPRCLPNNTALKSYLHMPPNVTLATRVDSTGAATPQLVTLSSSTTLQLCVDIRVTITATGVVGAATATYTVNGGSPVAFTVQSVVAIAGTPLSLNFPAGTYTAGDPYRPVISTVSDKFGDVWVGDSVAASVLPFVELVNGLPTIRTTTAGKRLFTNSPTLSAALLNGVRTPFSAIFTARYNGSLVDAVNTRVIFSISDGFSGAAIFYFGVFNGNWRTAKRGDSGGTIIVDGSAADNLFHTFQVVQSGTTVTVLVDGVPVINAAAQNIGVTCTTIIVVLGGAYSTGATPNFFSDCNWGDHAFYTGAIAAIPAGYIRQNFKNLWGTP